MSSLHPSTDDRPRGRDEAEEEEDQVGRRAPRKNNVKINRDASAIPVVIDSTGAKVQELFMSFLEK